LSALAGRNDEAQKLAAAAIDLGYPKESNPLPGAYALIALHARRYSEAAAVVIRTLDPLDREQARTAEVVRLVYAALADPTKRGAAIAARTRLYPGRNAFVAAATLTDVSPCLQSSVSYALIDALDVTYDLANVCLDQLAPGGFQQTATGYNFWIPELRAFRQDARFRALMTRIGFMEFWKQYGPPDDCDLKDGKLTCH
jgi:hypothetical protein